MGSLVQRWYSNTSIKWIWLRSIIVAILGALGILAVYGLENETLLETAVCVPLFLGMINALFRKDPASHHKSYK